MRARLLINHNTPSVAANPPGRAPLAFHQRLDGYVPTPLVDAPEIARHLRIGSLLLKIESERLGLPAFKILGASWAIYRTLRRQLPSLDDAWQTLDELLPQLEPLRPLALATATDGNHGRAVAHMARRLGFSAHIFVPQHTAQARIDAIAGEGARVTVVDGTYDDAVALAAREAGERCLVISDTSWPGYEEVPRWVMEGYSTIFHEIDDELARRGQAQPTLVAVQTGVGALAAAVVKHYRAPEHTAAPFILNVEPLRAACLLAAMEAGEIVEVPGPHDSIMAGLNCGRASLVAWPIIRRGMGGFIAIEDERAREAMRWLGESGIVAGETGAAGLAGLIELLTGPENIQFRQRLRIDENTRALILVTEGATDPRSYAKIVGSKAPR